jgi:hypothetical protein
MPSDGIKNLRPTPWRKGVSANPSGRPKTPEELKDCTPIELRRLIWSLWKMPRDDLKKLLANPETPAGVLFLANVYAKGIAQGDSQRLDMLLNRLIGKVKEVVEVQTSEALPTLEEAKQIIEADYALLPPPVVVVEDL